jgi:DNA-binding FadR family transcriptional regulator
MRIIELATGKRATVAQIDHGAMSLMIEHGVHTDQINIQQIYDVRRTIETRIVTLAAIRRSDAQAAEILELAEKMRGSAADPANLPKPGEINGPAGADGIRKTAHGWRKLLGRDKADREG